MGSYVEIILGWVIIAVMGAVASIVTGPGNPLTFLPIAIAVFGVALVAGPGIIQRRKQGGPDPDINLLAMEDRLHYFVSNSRLVAAFVAALIANFIATSMGYWMPAIGAITFDFNSINGVLWFKLYGTIFPKGPASPETLMYVGGWAHYWQGILFGIIYAYLVHPNLPGKLSPVNNILKGLIWGWTLFLISVCFWMPLLFNAGYLMLNFGAINTFGNFLWHTIYGFHLGAFYNPLQRQGNSAASASR
jgi:hypothetical protein